jgi:uncharacterized protein (TIGR02646 family)
MRPVERGTTTRTFTDFHQARGLLIERLGEYCSYCEMRANASLAIEHIQPKQKNPTLELEWTNFLLACGNCNPTKGDTEIALTEFYWADSDNTARAFVYKSGGFIQPNPNLSSQEQLKAEATIKLFGLEKRPPLDVEASDRRWSNRLETWEIAERALKRLKKRNFIEMREQIVDTAKAQAYWSIWMTVFKDDPDMLERLINAFAGTAKSCFDPVTFQPIPRVGGAI